MHPTKLFSPLWNPAVRSSLCIILLATALPLRAADPPRGSPKALEEQMKKESAGAKKP